MCVSRKFVEISYLDIDERKAGDLLEVERNFVAFPRKSWNLYTREDTEIRLTIAKIPKGY